MTSQNQADNRRDRGAVRKPYRLLGTAVLVAALGLVVLWIKIVHGGQAPVSTGETFAARRGPLLVSVLEAGALKAKDPEIIRSSVRHRATIISIVPEGTRVKKGDLLVELDVSELVDHCVDHRIWTTNAQAAWISAQEALIITKSLAQSNVELAELNYQFARLDLEKYEGTGGQYETDLAKAQGDIALAQADLEKNRDYYDWSRKLNAKKYLADTQLQADELTLDKSQLSLTVARNNLKLVEKYTHQQQLSQLRSNVAQTRAALERAQARARATVIQAEATLAAREQVYRHQREMLAMHEEEVRQSKLYAPVDGTVIYATSLRGAFRDDRQPLAEGVDVWHRQELIYLQKSDSTVAEVDLHEANLEKVRVGLPALVTIDALPGRQFMGTVTHIAPLANAQSMWTNPDLKVYETEIALDVNDPALRSGMNCRAEIILERDPDTIYVPVQAVGRVGGQPTVWVCRDDGQTQERRVELGLDDNRMVRIVSGLQENERVLLTRPRTGALEPGYRRAGLRGGEANEFNEHIQERLKAVVGLAPAGPQPNDGVPGPERTQ